jgi:hypothetical protein
MAQLRPRPTPEPAPAFAGRPNRWNHNDNCGHPILEGAGLFNGQLMTICNPLLIFEQNIDPVLAAMAAAARREHDQGGVWPPEEDVEDV